MNLNIHLRRPHEKQRWFIESQAKRKVVRAGRRGGKTTGAAILAVIKFLEGRRVLYAAPTSTQVEHFWSEVKGALEEPINTGVYYKNETLNLISKVGPREKAGIRAKTAWNADTLRGDYADLLILDEFQLMSIDTWDEVGAPMLLDNDGDAVFIYTGKRGSKHAKAMYEKAQREEEEAAEKGEESRWRIFHFTSMDNPHLSRVALDEIVQDMSHHSYRVEILAEEADEDPRALWDRDTVEECRVHELPPFDSIVIGVDPPGSGGGECGIVVAGMSRDRNRFPIPEAFIIDDLSRAGKPHDWARACIEGYALHDADSLVVETNFGGEMVETTIRSTEGGLMVPVVFVRASRGKVIRAEPVASLYKRGLVHHYGNFDKLEDEMCTWVPGERRSPNRLDAMVWAIWRQLLSYKDYGPAKAVPYV